MTIDRSLIDGISIGVVTHERARSFAKLLKYLHSEILSCSYACELIVANNSGKEAHSLIAGIVDKSALADICTCRILDSRENSVSVGRNVVLDAVQYQLLVFVDDDEYPETGWLNNLINSLADYDCDLIAGPIKPVFNDSTSRWIKTVDLHNAHGLATGDRIDYAASGNFIMNRAAAADIRFDETYGHSGGEDTLFFLQLKDRGLQMRWCAEAVVHEDIPVEKSTSRYMITRFMTQGATYRKIRNERGEIGSTWLFAFKAVGIFAVCAPIGLLLAVLGNPKAGLWLKRAFSNLGKIVNLDRQLYR